MPGFASRYKAFRLVYFEQSEILTLAAQRERTIKHWPRDWKVNLIERNNPHWLDLYDGIAN